MASIEEQAKLLTDDLEDNDEVFEEQMAEIFQMVKMAELSGDNEVKKGFQPMMKMINDGSRYFRTAAAMIRGDVSASTEKQAIQQKIRDKYKGWKGFIRLSNHLKRQDEMDEFDTLMNGMEVKKMLRSSRPDAGLRSSILKP